MSRPARRTRSSSSSQPSGLRFPGRHAPAARTPASSTGSRCVHDLVLFTLHNPRYAGAYFYGRRKQLTDINGHTRTVIKPRDQWTVLIEDAHPGYVTFEQYERNQQTLAANAAARGEERRAGPAREGPALLQGLVVCGKCGKRMTVSYHKRCNGEPQPDYHCSREGIATGTPPCQTICGAGIDAAVAKLVLEQLTPLAIETALAVSAELAQARRRRRSDPPDVQRAEHAAEAPAAATSPWTRPTGSSPTSSKPTGTTSCASSPTPATSTTAPPTPATGRSPTSSKPRSARSPTDLPALWANPATPMRERKRLIRLLVTDVTLNKTNDQIAAHVRLSGGQQHTLHVPRPLRAWEAHTTPPATIALIDQLLSDHTYDETVEILNQHGLTGGGATLRRPSFADPLCTHRGIASTTNGSEPQACSRSTRSPPSSASPPRQSRSGSAAETSPAGGPTTAAPTSTTPARPAPAPPRSKTTGKALGDSHRSGRSYHPEPRRPAAREMSVPHAILNTTPATRPDHRENPDNCRTHPGGAV